MIPVENQPEETETELETDEASAAQAESEEPVPAEEEAWILPDGKKGNKNNIESILSQISSLNCDEFIEGKKQEDFENPIYTITVKGTKNYTLNIFAKEDKEDGKYPAFTSENAFPFLLTVYTAELIMKKPEDLIQQDSKE